ncbi:MAG: hypothetical protein QOE96_3284 [Blastocatellia bacterium]|jgi:hypothetical protein|nr:hypothetical protein [Blastocatellia bacterium]
MSRLQGECGDSVNVGTTDLPRFSLAKRHRKLFYFNCQIRSCRAEPGPFQRSLKRPHVVDTERGIPPEFRTTTTVITFNK